MASYSVLKSFKVTETTKYYGIQASVEVEKGKIKSASPFAVHFLCLYVPPMVPWNTVDFPLLSQRNGGKLTAL